MNYEKLFKDKNDGTLDNRIIIIIDNDGGSIRIEDESITDNECEELADKYESIYGKPDGYRDIVKILNAAGIYAEWC